MVGNNRLDISAHRHIFASRGRGGYMEKFLFAVAMTMLTVSSFMELLFGIEEAGEESPADFVLLYPHVLRM